MMRHATDPGVFIRSLATRGRLGGLALGVQGVVRVMGLAGCDVVIVETVGVGQSEVEIAQNADVVMVVLAPGQGDSIQLLKAGLMEAGDLFVVNKADREGAAQLHQQLLAMLTLHQRVARGPGPMAECVGGVGRLFAAAGGLLHSAINHEGVPELADALDLLVANHAADWQARRRGQSIDEVRQAVVDAVSRRIHDALGANGAASGRLRQVVRGEISLDGLVDQLLRDAAERLPPPTAAEGLSGAGSNHEPSEG